MIVKRILKVLILVLICTYVIKYHEYNLSQKESSQVSSKEVFERDDTQE